jgi:hypothetical protein
MPYQQITTPIVFQQPSSIPPQFLSNYKAYYNPVIYQTYLSSLQVNQGGMKMGYPLQQINNQNISAFFSTPYTINYNSMPKQVNMPQHQQQQPAQNNAYYSQNNQYFRRSQQNTQSNYSNNRFRNCNDSLPKKNATEILNIESKVLQDPVEIEKWVLSRKRNFPSERNIIEKQEKGKIKESAGVLSKLELTLRDRLKIMNQIDKKKFVRRRTFKRRRSKRPKKDKNTDPELGEIVQEGNEKIQENNKVFQSNSSGNAGLNTENSNQNHQHRQNISNNGFKYRKNRLYENMIKNEKIKEMNVVLQCFRYFVNEGIV